jgi:hypothetical protein
MALEPSVGINFRNDTLVINGNQYIKVTVDNNDESMRQTEFIRCLLSIKGDTIVPVIGPKTNDAMDNYLSFTLKDINKDGKLDIMAELSSNAGDIYDTYFFDTKTNDFKLVMEANKPITFLEGKKNYFYSYFSADCAGENAHSFLYQFIDFSMVKVGKIEELKCDEDSKNHKVNVYKKEKLIQEVSMDNYIGAEKYWKKNLKLFKNK